jgi:hypothetical protein
MYIKKKTKFKKIAKFPETETWDALIAPADEVFSYGHLSDFFKSDFFFHNGHQLYPSEYIYFKHILSVPSGGETGLSMLSFSWKEAEINHGIIR